MDTPRQIRTTAELEVLSKHQIAARGVTATSPDVCRCGADVVPEPLDYTQPLPAGSGQRSRDLAFARHQADAHHREERAMSAFPPFEIEETPDGLIARETIDNAAARFARVCAAAEDDAIRRQLVALGWTPPGEVAQPVPEASREDVGKVVWAASHADEGTISGIGANVVAGALLARFVITERGDR